MENYIVDIGNSRIKILDANSNHFFSITNDDLDNLPISVTKDSSFYISSVNQKTSKALVNYLTKLGVKNISFLDNETMSSYCEKTHIKIDNIKILGADLFADIVGSKSDNSKNEIVVDLGTATKILAVNNKVFLGGVIFPGVTSCSKILTNNTELKDLTDLDFPSSLLSLETLPAVNAGSIYGTALMIKNYIEKIIETYALLDCEITFTGGSAKLILESYNKLNIKTNYVLDEIRTLRGIKKVKDVLNELKKG